MSDRVDDLVRAIQQLTTRELAELNRKLRRPRPPSRDEEERARLREGRDPRDE